MAINYGGQISAANIGYELQSRTISPFSIRSARLGSYGAINDASGFRPTGGGQNGDEYDDWWGYNHRASYPYVYAFVRERETDTNLRFYVTNAYGANVLADAWLYGNTGPWTDVGSSFGVRIRERDRIQVLWNWFGWGTFARLVYKAVYSNQRGTFINYGCDPAYIQRVNEFIIQSGELIYCYAVDDRGYC
jgi:hypothetical protein